MWQEMSHELLSLQDLYQGDGWCQYHRWVLPSIVVLQKMLLLA